MGTLYAYEQLGITPDILTSAKGLGNGFPVAAMLTTADIASHLVPGTHGSTYGGNPLACAIAAKVLEIVDQPDVLTGVNNKFELFKAGLAKINSKTPFYDELRGRGLLLGCALTKAYQGQASLFQAAALEAGVMTLVAGPNVIRFAPSLLIPDADIEEGLSRFAGAVAKVLERQEARDL